MICHAVFLVAVLAAVSAQNAESRGTKSFVYRKTTQRMDESLVSIGYLAANAPHTSSKSSMKGWELYIWQQDGDTYFSLLPGTNRLKTDAEITAAAVKGIDAIQPKLDELKAGESVFPCGRRLADQAPEEPAEEIRTYCRKLGLDVQR